MLFFLRLLSCITFLGIYFMPLTAYALAPGKVCALYTARHERLKGIPRHLLAAISKVESGSYDKATQEIIAWPWTINAEGKGFRYKTKHEAIKAVRKMQRQGIKSIDVGCMQVNLRHHKSAFRTLEDAFDPRKNIDYAAEFLSKLKETHKSWTKAVAHYHSATPKHHRPYRKKVYDTWRAERLNDRQPSSDDKAVSHWASLRDRARAKNHLIKTSAPKTSLSRYKQKKSSRKVTVQSNNPLDRYRARAQRSLMRLKQHRKKPPIESTSSSPILLAGASQSDTHHDEQTLSFPTKRYANVRERARNLLARSKTTTP